MSLPALQQWIAANRPDLDAEFRNLRIDHVRMRLNELTGLNIGPNESINDTAHLYVEALKTEVSK